MDVGSERNKSRLNPNVLVPARRRRGVSLRGEEICGDAGGMGMKSKL